MQIHVQHQCRITPIDSAKEIKKKKNIHRNRHSTFIYAGCLCTHFSSPIVSLLSRILRCIYHLKFGSQLSIIFSERYSFSVLLSRFWTNWDYSKRWNVTWKKLNSIIAVMKDRVEYAHLTFTPKKSFYSITRDEVTIIWWY